MLPFLRLLDKALYIVRLEMLFCFLFRAKLVMVYFFRLVFFLTVLLLRSNSVIFFSVLKLFSNFNFFSTPTHCRIEEILNSIVYRTFYLPAISSTVFTLHLCTKVREMSWIVLNWPDLVPEDTKAIVIVFFVLFCKFKSINNLCRVE